MFCHVRAWITQKPFWKGGIKRRHNGNSVKFRLSSSLDEVSNMLLSLGLDLEKEQFSVSGCDGAHIFTQNAVLCDVGMSASASNVSQASCSEHNPVCALKNSPWEERRDVVRQSQQSLQWQAVSIRVWHETLLQCLVRRGMSSVACR